MRILLGIAAAAVALLAVACDGEETWRGPGADLREVEGDAHCDWESVRFLAVTDDFWSQIGIEPPATAYTFFARDPDDLLVYMAAAFTRLDALPADAIDTGYRNGRRTLYVSPSDPYTAVYVHSPSHIEAWPRFDGGCD
ncbi:MAG: hypothetical protein IT303_06590 [Dehalococcoidia bacterium]|nr:hypothetical protein [Dehalococcoidia bacterium]